MTGGRRSKGLFKAVRGAMPRPGLVARTIMHACPTRRRRGEGNVRIALALALLKKPSSIPHPSPGGGLQGPVFIRPCTLQNNLRGISNGRGQQSLREVTGSRLDQAMYPQVQFTWHLQQKLLIMLLVPVQQGGQRHGGTVLPSSCRARCSGAAHVFIITLFP